MGKVLIMCAGEQERWKAPVPKQIIMVDNEQLLSRTVRQVRRRMNNYPHIISHQKCLRTYSTNYVCPSSRRYLCDTLLSIKPIWGKDWTLVLMGDVYYTEDFMDTLYFQRDKFHYHFYGTAQEIYACTYTDTACLERALINVSQDVLLNQSKGDIWDLYYKLSENIPAAGDGYLGSEDILHYTYITDGSRDFNSTEDYRLWKRKKGG